MNQEPTWALWIAAFVGGATLLAGWLAVLAWIGVDTTALGWMLVALVLAVGLALRPLLTDVASGIVLRTSGAVAVGDVVRCGQVEGVVRDHLATFLRIEQADGTWVALAHRHAFRSPLVNLSRSGRRRVKLVFTLPAAADLESTEQAILGVLADDERVLDAPAPDVCLTVLDDDQIRLEATAWVSGDPRKVEGRLTLATQRALGDTPHQAQHA